MVADNVDLHSFYWGIKTKFSLEIGIQNEIDPSYEKIIWFPQGIYVINTFNTTKNTNSYNISISGKDKMCLLNGELGGNLPASIDFAKKDMVTYTYKKLELKAADYEPYVYYIYQNKEYVLVRDNKFDPKKVYYQKIANVEQVSLTLKQILTEAIINYGGESVNNLIINDLDIMGLELLEYRGQEQNLYMLYDTTQDIYTNMIVNDSQPIYILDKKGNYIQKTIADLEDNEFRTGVVDVDEDATEVYFKLLNTTTETYTVPYNIAKFETGNSVGYRLTDLVYAGELISSYGQAITEIISKIVSMLGNFEYFYDLDGRFIFQQKKNYINTSWNPLVDTGDDIYVDVSDHVSKTAYDFKTPELISSFQNTPVLANIKNDFSVWGSRKTATGNQIPIHMRYAIDNKPSMYTNFDGVTYVSSRRSEIMEDVVEAAIKKYSDELESFTLQYQNLPSSMRPEKQKDGSYSVGWWDIRDWYRYYTLLTGTVPNGTMKWYSTNTIDGCIPLIQALTPLLNNGYSYSKNGYTYTNSSELKNNKDIEKYCVWMLQIPKNSKQLTTSIHGHGYGDPQSQGHSCIFGHLNWSMGKEKIPNIQILKNILWSPMLDALIHILIYIFQV